MRADEVGRGCETIARHCNRESDFFVIALEKVFSFRADWHQDHRAKPLVRQYQTALDAVLTSHPELLRCVALCTHCGMRFLTHPRNAGRLNLRCPAGCRRHHHQHCSNQRSAAYYQTPEGKAKKKRLNARRSCRPASPDCQPPTDSIPHDDSPVDQPPVDQPPVDPSLKIELRLEGVVLDQASVANSRMLPYVRMLVSLIEGLPRSQDEIVRLLQQAMRQHSIVYRMRTDYVLCFLHQHPP